MPWDFENLRKTAEQEIQSTTDLKGLEALRLKYLSRKGLVTQIYASLAELSSEERPSVGKGANDFKSLVTRLTESKKKEISETRSLKVPRESLDVTLPGVASQPGHSHILTQTMDQICGIFETLGFVVQEGPEIETEFNNFTALNIPVNHPSRDAFDTFYLEAPDPENKTRNLLLRSHTSPGQIRIMKEYKPPLAVVIPGKVYRPDAVDASHSFMFHQVEGLLVDRDVKFSDLKGLLTIFCQRFFPETIKMRFRPHFFPFTEPSAEVDISCYLCEGKGWLVKPRESGATSLPRDPAERQDFTGCSVCGKKGWLEIMGCGLVHPQVFAAVGYPKNKYTGLAFGMGVERLAMLKYGINDIRIFFENDARFLRQF